MAEAKRIIPQTDYEVTLAVKIGDRELVIGVDMNEPSGQYYVKAEYYSNGIVGQYHSLVYYRDYLAAMEEFIGAIDQKIIVLRSEFNRSGLQEALITAADCYPHDCGQNLRGKVVAIKAEVLRPEYRRGDQQLVLVHGGFGANANGGNKALLCDNLRDGTPVNYRRTDVLGVMKELPDWAKERLAALQAEHAAEFHQGRGAVGRDERDDR